MTKPPFFIEVPPLADNEEDEKKTPFFLPLLVLLAVWPLRMLWYGFVVSTLWLWFVVPAWGIRPISVHEAAAYALITALYRAQTFSSSEEKGWVRTRKLIFMGFCFPLFALGFGWVWKALGAFL